MGNIPQTFGPLEIDAMLLFVAPTFLRIELEVLHPVIV